jgi:hypothetical protein
MHFNNKYNRVDILGDKNWKEGFYVLFKEKDWTSRFSFVLTMVQNNGITSFLGFVHGSISWKH